MNTKKAITIMGAVNIISVLCIIISMSIIQDKINGRFAVIEKELLNVIVNYVVTKVDSEMIFDNIISTEFKIGSDTYSVLINCRVSCFLIKNQIELYLRRGIEMFNNSNNLFKWKPVEVIKAKETESNQFETKSCTLCESEIGLAQTSKNGKDFCSYECCSDYHLDEIKTLPEFKSVIIELKDEINKLNLRIMELEKKG